MLFLPACDFPSFDWAEKKFDDQHFKSAIAHIELHNVRNGEYPDSLKNLQHLGEWDAMWLSNVTYDKTTSGYNLSTSGAFGSKATLIYPSSFKQGLGLEGSNVQFNATGSSRF